VPNSIKIRLTQAGQHIQTSRPTLNTQSCTMTTLSSFISCACAQVKQFCRFSESTTQSNQKTGLRGLSANQTSDEVRISHEPNNLWHISTVLGIIWWRHYYAREVKTVRVMQNWLQTPDRKIDSTCYSTAYVTEKGQWYFLFSVSRPKLSKPLLRPSSNTDDQISYGSCQTNLYDRWIDHNTSGL
jgi:hypothetical protein